MRGWLSKVVSSGSKRREDGSSGPPSHGSSSSYSRGQGGLGHTQRTGGGGNAAEEMAKAQLITRCVLLSSQGQNTSCPADPPLYVCMCLSRPLVFSVGPLSVQDMRAAEAGDPAHPQERQGRPKHVRRVSLAGHAGAACPAREEPALHLHGARAGRGGARAGKQQQQQQ